MTSLKSLTFATLPKSTVNPTLDRRTKIIARLEEQKALLRDAAYMRAVRAWGKNDAGEKVMVEKKQRVLPCWSAQPNGSCVLFVRVGWKPVEFEKGKKPPLRYHRSTSCRRSLTQSLRPFEPGNSTSSWRTQARKRRRRSQRENRPHFSSAILRSGFGRSFSFGPIIAVWPDPPGAIPQNLPVIDRRRPRPIQG